MDVQVEVKGVNRVANKIRAIAAANKNIIDPSLREWGQNTRAKLKSTPYPPKPSGSTYVRTGRLASSWAFRKVSTAVYSLQNKAKQKGKYYASWVVDKLLQAWMHKGRWWIAQDIIEDEVPALRSKIIDTLRDVWRKS